jgi:hypothetical protein
LVARVDGCNQTSQGANLPDDGALGNLWRDLPGTKSFVEQLLRTG